MWVSPGIFDARRFFAAAAHKELKMRSGEIKGISEGKRCIYDELRIGINNMKKNFLLLAVAAWKLCGSNLRQPLI